MYSQYLLGLRTYLMVVCIFLWRAEARGECSPSGVHLRVSASSHRNATGHWNIDAFAYSDQSKFVQPHVSFDTQLDVDACPRGGVALSTKATVAAAAPAPAGYEKMPFSGTTSLYRLHTEAMTWQDARAACAGEGAHLIVVNSDAEARVVNEFFGRKPRITNAKNDYWLVVGFSKVNEGNMTVLGVAVQDSGYNKWAPLDGQWRPGAGQDCGIMDRRLLFAYEECSSKRGFICEFETLA